MDRARPPLFHRRCRVVNPDEKAPGSNEFTVTPSAATSRASVLRKPVTPARAVFDRMSVGIGWRTAIEVIATTLPHCCSRMAGTAS